MSGNAEIRKKQNKTNKQTNKNKSKTKPKQETLCYITNLKTILKITLYAMWHCPQQTMSTFKFWISLSFVKSCYVIMNIFIA